jgi:ribosomal protein L9
LITYFRDVQKSWDGRAKAIQSASNAINNANMPPGFLTTGGLGDAIHILKDYNRQSLTEGNKAREIETEIIAQLTGLRSDLQQKIKEIKSLSGDFKSSVDKEQEATKRAVRAFQDALGSVDHDSAASSGKGDPFIVKMGVDRQVERQIDEENYLHRVSPYA